MVSPDLMKNLKIPEYVENILRGLEKAGYEAYLVGGCVRDFLIGREPREWDITTNAKPEEIQKIFSRRSQSEVGTPTGSVGADYDTYYENEFGTVGVKVDLAGGKTEVVEVTTYRSEEKYTDKRHPDAVKFVSKLEDDLARRDLTINAMALKIKNQKSKIKTTDQNLKPEDYEIVDIFGGRKDTEAKVIRSVGNSQDRFNEDALRLMRAVRLAAQLGFEIEPETKSAIKKSASQLKAISHERIRDELIELIESDDPERGILLMQELGLLKIVLPELEEGVGVTQNKHHIYNVFEHSVKSLGFAGKMGFNTYVRFAALLHDIGKPRAKAGEGPEATFYGHEFVGAKMAARALERLRFPKDFIEKVYTLVRYHMFYYNVGEVTERSVRRLVRKVGPENMEELLQLRQAERKGSGVPKAEPYKLRHLKFMVEKVSRDPLTVGMLKVNGDDVMRTLGIEPGPKVGYILNALLEEVLDEPSRNDREYLTRRMKELAGLPMSELVALAEAGKEKLEGEREREEKGIKERYFVK